MKNITLTDLLLKYGSDDNAREFLEKLRWAKGVKCPRCQSDRYHKLTPKPGSKNPVRDGVYFCGGCRKQFTVTVGTIMESSHIPLAKWIAAFFLMCASKKSISSKQLERMLGLTYKSAWFMAHRIRHAMNENPTVAKLYGTVEVDETYVGGKPRFKGQSKKGRGTKKTPVMVLVERNGRARTEVVKNVTGKTLKSVILANVDKSSTIMTDEWQSYNGIGKHFDGGHEVVNHGRREYVRGDAYTNTSESFFALLKRGIVGAYHHVSQEHLHRYCNEFAFRWNNRKISDGERMATAIGMIGGKRLMYKDSLR